MIYDIIRNARKPVSLEFEKLMLLNAISQYLIEEDNYTALLDNIGRLMKYYQVNIKPNDLKPLKREFTRNEITMKVGELIINDSGNQENLLSLLKMIVTYKNTI